MKRTNPARSRAGTLLRRIILPLVAAVLPPLATRPVRSAILGSGWTYRRVLQVPPVPAGGAPGVNQAWAQFYTNQARLPDGRDLRVTAANRVTVPMRILSISRRDGFVRLAFSAPRPGKYIVWWGNPKAPVRKTGLKPDRGVLMRVYKWPPGWTGSEKAMARDLQHRGKLLQGLYRKQIFIGFDPCGDNRRDMFSYTTMLHIARSGTYHFAFDVDDAGFIRLNHKTLLVKTQGGGMWGHVRFQKEITLTSGWYPLRAGQFNFNGPTGIALDWRTPGQKGYTPVPASAFAPIARAKVGSLKKFGAVYVADCRLHSNAELFVPPRFYLTQWTFEARVPPSFAPTVTWNFGDGQTARGLRVRHEYLLPGAYVVHMTVQQAGNTFTATRRILVHFRPYSLYPRPPRNTAGSVARRLLPYNLAMLSARALRRGMLFYRGYGPVQQRIRWGLAWAAKRRGNRPVVQWRDALALARVCIAQRQFSNAAKVYRLMARKRVPFPMRAKAMLYYGQCVADYTPRAGHAFGRLRAWRQSVPRGQGGPRRTVAVAMAYAAMAQGNGAKARRWIKKAGPLHTQTYNVRAIRQGVLARNIEVYIRNGHIDTAGDLLSQWAWRYPEAIRAGYLVFLRMKLLEEKRHPSSAGRLATAYVKAFPTSFYADHLLYKAYRDLTAANKSAEALAAEKKLRTKYPESPFIKKLAKR